MSVSIWQKVTAYAAQGIARGHITIDVTVTNNGPEAIIGSAGGVHFAVLTSSGAYLTDIRRTDPRMADATAPLPQGASFERQIHIDVAPVDVGQQYTLKCIFDQTGDIETSSFTFRPLYLETPGQPPFNQG